MFRTHGCESTRAGALRSCTRGAEWARAREEYVDLPPSFFFGGIRIRCGLRSFRLAWKAWRALRNAASVLDLVVDVFHNSLQRLRERFAFGFRALELLDLFAQLVHFGHYRRQRF